MDNHSNNSLEDSFLSPVYRGFSSGEDQKNMSPTDSGKFTFVHTKLILLTTQVKCFH